MTISHGHFKAGQRMPSTAAIGSRPLAGNEALAQQLIDLGYALIPLDQSKRPLTHRGFHDAKLDASPWKRCQASLIGIPTAKFWVLDLDAPLDSCVPRLCSLLRLEWRELSAACGLIVRTPRGGLHLYLARTPSVAIRTSAGDIAKGIDTRGHDGDGNPTGYIVAPGCVLADGRRYKVESGSLDALSEAPVRLLWLASLSRTDRSRIAADPELMAALRSAEPSAWREILNANLAATRVNLPPLSADASEPIRRQALHDLDAERYRLSRLTDGRRNAIFESAARLARYAANEVLSRQEIESGLIEAWQASGADKKHGMDYPCGAITRALDKGRNDPLPPLARCFRDASGRVAR